MRPIFAALLLLPLTACGYFGGDADETLTASELGDVDTLDGTISDDMVDLDTAATPAGEVEVKPVEAAKVETAKEPEAATLVAEPESADVAPDDSAE